MGVHTQQSHYLCWGITQTAFGFVNVWYQLVPLRLLLGLFEAGVFPASIYLISCWFRRYELQKRVAVFYVLGTIASAFTGILAYGFSQMQGLGRVKGWAPSDNQNGGIAGWRWIFIMMGLITILISVVSFFYIAYFPDVPICPKTPFTASFVGERERKYLLARIEDDRQDTVPTSFNLREFGEGALDSKIWVFSAIFCFTTMTNYAVAYFMPIILNVGMGFSVEESQLLSCPPYIFACLVMALCGWLGDKYRIRSPIVILNSLTCVAGFCLVGFCGQAAIRYLGLFLVTGAGSTNISAVVTWQANNIRGQWKRAFSSATLIGAGGIGGIIGGTVFRSQDAPTYYPGVYACLIANGLSILLSGGLVFKFVRANRRVAADGSTEVIEGLEGFRYTI